jgi:predicted RNA-binding Zn-ribbon protein involved in translation (DUF1610 family)
MDKSTYKLDVLCTNCTLRENIEIPVGTKVEDHACPTCGNKTLRKRLNVDLSARPTNYS